MIRFRALGGCLAGGGPRKLTHDAWIQAGLKGSHHFLHFEWRLEVRIAAAKVGHDERKVSRKPQRLERIEPWVVRVVNVI